jgi:hypothetical protein
LAVIASESGYPRRLGLSDIERIAGQHRDSVLGDDETLNIFLWPLIAHSLPTAELLGVHAIGHIRYGPLRLYALVGLLIHRQEAIAGWQELRERQAGHEDYSCWIPRLRAAALGLDLLEFLGGEAVVAMLLRRTVTYFSGRVVAEVITSELIEAWLGPVGWALMAITIIVELAQPPSSEEVAARRREAALERYRRDIESAEMAFLEKLRQTSFARIMPAGWIDAQGGSFAEDARQLRPYIERVEARYVELGRFAARSLSTNNGRTEETGNDRAEQTGSNTEQATTRQPATRQLNEGGVGQFGASP